MLTDDSQSIALSLQAYKAMQDSHYREAADLFADLIQHLESTLGKNHPETAVALINLAEALDYQQNYEVAKAHRARAFQIMRCVKDAEWQGVSPRLKAALDDLERARSRQMADLEILSFAYTKLGDWEQAERIEKAIENLKSQ